MKTFNAELETLAPTRKKKQAPQNRLQTLSAPPVFLDIDYKVPNN
jgi:hypothetical protein